MRWVLALCLALVACSASPPAGSYVGLGHPTARYADPAFRSLLLGGLRYAAGT